eukprot:scaffold121281_cov48-Phaeocystis_antarctica.AAC.3
MALLTTCYYLLLTAHRLPLSPIHSAAQWVRRDAALSQGAAPLQQAQRRGVQRAGAGVERESLRRVCFQVEEQRRRVVAQWCLARLGPALGLAPVMDATRAPLGLVTADARGVQTARWALARVRVD